MIRQLACTATFILCSPMAYADKQVSTPINENLTQLGFGPALFLLNYSEPVFDDSKDVRLRSDGTLTAPGSKSGTALGVEVHYGFSFRNMTTSYTQTDGTSKFSYTSGHVISPFLGLFDVDNGLNGIAAGAIYGYWRGDKDYKKQAALNVGIGKFVHRNRTVLARGMSVGVNPPPGLLPEDFTSKKDVTGWTLMISATLGF